MTLAPKVSIVLPVYNHGKFISAAIKSVLNQTFKDFELIITDDASTDNTPNIINNFNDPRIKIFRFEKNSGISAAMNNCILNSRGKYIAHINADDTYHKNKLEKQIAFLENNENYGAVFTRINLIDDNGNDFKDASSFYSTAFDEPNRNRFKWLRHFFYNGNCLGHPSVVIRRECFDNIGYYDIRFHQLQDVETWIRICSKYEIHILDEKLTNFRVVSNNGNVSADSPKSRVRLLWEGTKLLDNFLLLKIEDLEKTFTEMDEFKKPLDQDLMQYYLAMLALKVNSITHRHFAMETLFNFFGNKNKTKKLYDIYGITSQELIRLGGELDIFSANTIKKSYSFELKNICKSILNKTGFK